jgi:hypothetical protein
MVTLVKQVVQAVVEMREVHTETAQQIKVIVVVDTHLSALEVLAAAVVVQVLLEFKQVVVAA